MQPKHNVVTTQVTMIEFGTFSLLPLQFQVAALTLMTLLDAECT